MRSLRVGVIGCGNISPIYLKNLTAYEDTEIVAVADLVREKAQERAEEYGIKHVLGPDELIASPEVELVLNLTIPAAHDEIALKAIAAGKHVYNEKPLALTLSGGRKIVEAAATKGLYVGCAPDTVLGAGIQTCRKLIDDGAIGDLVGAHAFMMCPGHESWHPSPAFYYQQGGGPMLDMGPYYVSALVTLLGPIARTFGLTSMTHATRTITSEPLNGTVVEVEVPTHQVGLFEMANGAIVQLTTSFDIQGHTLPNIQVYGTEGSLQVPDPNGFGGPVKIKRKGGDWEDVELTHGFAENSRGLGVLDIANAITEGRACRASGELALHVLEAMLSVNEASEARKAIEMTSSFDLPLPMPTV